MLVPRPSQIVPRVLCEIQYLRASPSTGSEYLQVMLIICVLAPSLIECVCVFVYVVVPTHWLGVVLRHRRNIPQGIDN